MPNITRRKLLQGAAAAGAIAALNVRLAEAQAQSRPEVVGISPDLIARAKREGTIMMRYASPVEVMTPIVKEFERQFGIKVLLDRKALASHPNRKVADIAKKLPANTYVEGWGYCPHWTDLMIPYNPAVVSHAKAKEIFKTWHGLLDPSLSGKIGLVEPAATNLAFLTYMMFFELPQYGRAFFQKLAAQKPRLYSGSAQGREDISAGAIGTFIPAWESAAFLAFLGGDKTAWIYPDVAPSTAENHIAISKHAPHPAAARLLAAWAFTEEGARAIMLSETRPTLLGIKDERSALIKLRQTEWFTPMRPNSSWVPSHDSWSKVYPTLMPEMRKTLGWRG